MQHPTEQRRAYPQGLCRSLWTWPAQGLYRLLSENGFAVIDYDEANLKMEARPLVAKT